MVHGWIFNCHVAWLPIRDTHEHRRLATDDWMWITSQRPKLSLQVPGGFEWWPHWPLLLKSIQFAPPLTDIENAIGVFEPQFAPNGNSPNLDLKVLGRIFQDSCCQFPLQSCVISTALFYMNETVLPEVFSALGSVWKWSIPKSYGPSMFISSSFYPLQLPFKAGIAGIAHFETPFFSTQSQTFLCRWPCYSSRSPGSWKMMKNVWPGFRVIWLVVEPYPSEKYARQLGWWHSQLNGKIQFIFQTTNQPCFMLWSLFYVHYVHLPFSNLTHIVFVTHGPLIDDLLVKDGDFP